LQVFVGVTYVVYRYTLWFLNVVWGVWFYKVEGGD